MKPFSLVVSAFCLTALVGCGTSVQQSLKNNPELRTNIGQGKRVVVLPFADYTDADNLESAFRRNLFVSENLSDRLVQNGFTVPVQEDVFRYLIGRNIIDVVAYSGTLSSSIDHELTHGDWSPAMRQELGKYKNFMRGGSPATDSPGTLGLDTAEVSQLGQTFGADYVLRGSIVQYKSRKDPSWEPWKKGIIPFVTGVTNKIAFGQANADAYDQLANIVAGGFLGSLYGYSSNKFLVKGHGRAGNVSAWGAIGAGLGALADETGDIPQAVVQLRMWVQDAYNGDVVWTNRVDVKVSPESFLADQEYDVLFEAATEKAVAALMDDFLYRLNPSVQTMAREREAQYNKRNRR